MYLSVYIIIWLSICAAMTWLIGWNILTYGLWLYNGTVGVGIGFWTLAYLFYPELVGEPAGWMKDLDDSYPC